MEAALISYWDSFQFKPLNITGIGPFFESCKIVPDFTEYKQFCPDQPNIPLYRGTDKKKKAITFQYNNLNNNNNNNKHTYTKPPFFLNANLRLKCPSVRSNTRIRYIACKKQ